MKESADLDAILAPVGRENLTKTLPRCHQVGPRHRPRAAREAPKRNFRANLGSIFSVFEQSWHKIKDLADLDAILVPFLRENLIPSRSKAPSKSRPRGIFEPIWAQMALKLKATMHHELTSYLNASLKLILKRI